MYIYIYICIYIYNLLFFIHAEKETGREKEKEREREKEITHIPWEYLCSFGGGKPNMNMLGKSWALHINLILAQLILSFTSVGVSIALRIPMLIWGET